MMSKEIGINWSAAACRNGDPDALFVQGAEQNVAKRICRGCPIKLDCLADALNNRIEHGVWGGMTARERRALLRRHPAVANWKRTLEATQQQQAPVPATTAGPVGNVAVEQTVTSQPIIPANSPALALVVPFPLQSSSPAKTLG